MEYGLFEVGYSFYPNNELATSKQFFKGYEEDAKKFILDYLKKEPEWIQNQVDCNFQSDKISKVHIRKIRYEKNTIPNHFTRMKFIGTTDKRLGYVNGIGYDLLIGRFGNNSICYLNEEKTKPIGIVIYGSIKAFFNNWETI